MTASVTESSSAAVLISSEAYAPIVWGPSMVGSQFAEYSVQVTSDGALADEQYLNVVRSDGTWVIENLPVGDEPGILTVANSFHVARFTDGMSYQTTLHSTIIGAPPLFAAGAVHSLGAPRNFMADNGHGLADAGPFTAPGEPEDFPKVDGPILGKHMHKGMPDINQGTEECVPTSVANSITWLNDRHKLGINMTTEEIRDKLKVLMKTNNNPDGKPGTTGNNFINGKKLFTDGPPKLPIITKDFDGSSPARMPTIANMLKELKDGEDVEINVQWKSGGGHIMTLVGVIDLGDNGAKIGLKDPADGKQQTVWQDVHTVDGQLVIKGYGANFIETFVSESVVPEPATLFMLAVASVAGLALRRPRPSGRPHPSHRVRQPASVL